MRQTQHLQVCFANLIHMTSSAIAELSSITSQVEELMKRITSIGDQYRMTPDSQLVTECNSAERSLMSGIRAMERAKKFL